MANNSEWGPPLWRILHTLAERLGRQASPILVADETRLWAQLLKGVEAVMPCAICRGHYAAWKKAHPFQHGESRKWLWDLHEAVNARRGVAPEARVAFADLTAIYGARRTRMDLQEDIRIFLAILQKAALTGAVDGGHVRVWKGVLATLRSLLGF
jgi:hypothetical protein